MKILSIITVGGRHIKRLCVYFIIMLLLQSCSSLILLQLDNNKFSYDVPLSDGSMVKIGCIYAPLAHSHYLTFDLKGKYVLNYDSLKLKFADENIIRFTGSYHDPESKKHKYNGLLVENDNIRIAINYEQKNKNKEIKEPKCVFLLPSDFIMKDDKRVLTDSFRFVLFKPDKTCHRVVQKKQ